MLTRKEIVKIAVERTAKAILEIAIEAYNVDQGQMFNLVIQSKLEQIEDGSFCFENSKLWEDLL